MKLGNKTTKPFIEKGGAKSFINLFQEQVSSNPDGIAIVAEAGQVTFRELDDKSTKLAKYLISEGVKSENLVGLCASLSIDFIVYMLGILKSGAAYFPLDPAYPVERLTHMLQSGAPSVILTEARYAGLFTNGKGKIVKIDEDSSRIFSNTYENVALSVTKPEDLAYVIYTSGSTGKPKGIMVTHESLPNVALAHNQYYPSNIRMLVSGGVCFDASLLVIFHALINNECLYLFDYTPKEKVDVLLEFIELHAISYLICVPSQYNRLLQKNRKLPFLKCVSLTGENLPSSLCELHAKLAPNAYLYNEYGPTECAIGTSIAKIYDPNDRVVQKITVGVPLPNTEVYILDHNLNMLPNGEKGEICVGGVGLARGYLGNAALTKKQFVSVTFSGQKTMRLYRTGDLGRFLPNGELEFLGRAEQRAYISRKWIDLGEIEYYISRCPDIKESALTVQKNSQGKRQLVAYVTSKKISVKNSLYTYLGKALPKHMIPTAVIRVDKFPLSPNGKIDREALVNLYA